VCSAAEPSKQNQVQDLNRLGIAAYRKMQYAEAQSVFDRALEMARTIDDAGRTEASVLSNLAVLKHAMGDEAAAKIFEQTVDKLCPKPKPEPEPESVKQIFRETTESGQPTVTKFERSVVPQGSEYQHAASTKGVVEQDPEGRACQDSNKFGESVLKTAQMVIRRATSSDELRRFQRMARLTADLAITFDPSSKDSPLVWLEKSSGNSEFDAFAVSLFSKTKFGLPPPCWNPRNVVGISFTAQVH
jgi:hypothetical protein